MYLNFLHFFQSVKRTFKIQRECKISKRSQRTPRKPTPRCSALKIFGILHPAETLRLKPNPPAQKKNPSHCEGSRKLQHFTCHNEGDLPTHNKLDHVESCGFRWFPATRVSNPFSYTVSKLNIYILDADADAAGMRPESRFACGCFGDGDGDGGI